MSSEWFKSAYNGVSISRAQLDKIATGAAHADDYVFQELLKLARYQGSAVDRVIVPFQVRNASNNGGGLVQGGNPANPIQVLPFRAILGPRTQSTDTPPTPPSPLDPLITTAAELAVRDIRSAVFAGPAASGAPGTVLPSSMFAPNVSGNPRFDLIYAALYIDQPATSTQVIVKPPVGSSGPVSASNTRITSVGSPPMAMTGPTPAIFVAMGATSSTAPQIPALPGDVPASGVYYFPLAAVVIPGTFTPGTTPLSTHGICILAPIAEIAEALSGRMTGPMSAISGARVAALTKLPGAGSTADNWGTAGRPGFAAPVTMRGGVEKFLLLDGTAAAGSAPLDDTAIIDDSLDWRNRYFEVVVQATNNGFASDPTASGGSFTPAASANTIGVSTAFTFGQSFKDDSVAQLLGGVGSSRNAGTVCSWGHTNLTAIAASGNAAIGLYVDLTTGSLRLYYAATPGTKIMMIVRATGAYDNLG